MEILLNLLSLSFGFSKKKNSFSCRDGILLYFTTLELELESLCKRIVVYYVTRMLFIHASRRTMYVVPVHIEALTYTQIHTFVNISYVLTSTHSHILSVNKSVNP